MVKKRGKINFRNGTRKTRNIGNKYETFTYDFKASKIRTDAIWTRVNTFLFVGRILFKNKDEYEIEID